MSLLLHPLCKKPAVIIWLCIVLALCFGFFYCKKPEVPIATVFVTRGSITEHAEAVGYIKTSHPSTVKSQVDGIVEAIYHEEGDYITKNTPLLKVRPAPNPDVYAMAHQNLVDASIEENHAETNLKRYQQLLEARVISENDHTYTDVQKVYSSAKSKKGLAEQKLALLTRGETVVNGKTIANIVNSPIDGFILYRNVNIGDPVISISSAQAATTLFIVANMQDLMFQGTVDESDVAKIKIGMIAKIKIGPLPDQEIVGTISRIALQSDKENPSATSANVNQLSPFNVGFKIEIAKLQLPKNMLMRSGYSATASIAVKKVDNVLVLPLRVIQFKDAKSHVLLLVKGSKKPKQQAVELGISDGINVEIKSGLKINARVIDQPDATVVTPNS